MTQMTYLQNRNRLRDTGNQLGATERERVWGGVNEALGISTCKPLHTADEEQRGTTVDAR